MVALPGIPYDGAWIGGRPQAAPTCVHSVFRRGDLWSPARSGAARKTGKPPSSRTGVLIAWISVLPAGVAVAAAVVVVVTAAVMAVVLVVVVALRRRVKGQLPGQQVGHRRRAGCPPGPGRRGRRRRCRRR